MRQKLKEDKSLNDKYDRMVKRVAVNIRRIRKEKGLTQAKMIEYGFDLRNFQRLESGDHSPALYSLMKCAIAFKCDIREFFD